MDSQSTFSRHFSFITHFSKVFWKLGPGSSAASTTRTKSRSLLTVQVSINLHRSLSLRINLQAIIEKVRFYCHKGIEVVHVYLHLSRLTAELSLDLFKEKINMYVAKKICELCASLNSLV